MWWGGGGSHQSPPEAGDPSSPISMPGRGSKGEGSSEESPPGSLSSSYGSPGSDLAEMRDLRNQFNNQEQLLGQLRDVLQTNSQRIQSKEKEDYASRLAQMRSHRKPPVAKLITSTPEKEEEEEMPGISGGKKNTRGSRMQMLRKQLDESKARQDAELSSRQDLENIVAGLQRELEERDTMISNMSVVGSVTSSTLGSPFVMSPEQGSPTDSPGQTTPPSGYGGAYSSSYYDLNEQVSAKENKVLELNEQVANLNRKVFDLEENLKEKDEVISARTAAVGLASASLAAKGKDTLDQLEDTRVELMTVQERWAREQMEWKREREETKILFDSASARVETLQEANKRLERSKEELSFKSQELREQVVKLETELAGVKSKTREEKILLEARMEELEEEKVGFEEKRQMKEKILQERITSMETRRSEAQGHGKLSTLENSLVEAEEERGALQLRLVDMEEIVAAEQKLKSRVKDAEETSRRMGDELDGQVRAVNMMEAEKLDLMEALATRDTELFALQEEVEKLVGGREDMARGRLEVEMRCVELEEQRDQWEGEKIELVQQIEHQMIQAKEDLIPLTELQENHAALVAEHQQFSQEYQTALDKSKLYDKDMLGKIKRIKEQNIELKTLEQLLHEKTKEISGQLTEVDKKNTELIKAKETIKTFEDVISRKEEELSELNDILSESEVHKVIDEMKSKIAEQDQEIHVSADEKNRLLEEFAAKSKELDEIKTGFLVEKESLNHLLEESSAEQQNITEESNTKIKELEEIIECKSMELEEKINCLDQSTKDMVTIEKELEDAKCRLKNNGTLIEEMKQSLNVKDTSLISFKQDVEDYHLKLQEKGAEVDELNKSLLENVDQHNIKLNKLEQKLTEKSQEIEELDASVKLKSEEVSMMNEEIMSKYKIIEDLQSDLESFGIEKEKLVEEQSTMQSSIGNLQSNVENLSQTKFKLNEELNSKDSALGRLQTVIDVFEANSSMSESTSEEINKKILEITKKLSSKDEIIVRLEKELENKNIVNDENISLKEEIAGLLKSKQDCEDLIISLEQENHSIGNITSELAEMREIVIGKEEQVVSLQEKIDTISKELSSKEKDLFETNLSEDKSSHDQQYLDQIEHFKIQLREKSELHLASESDSKLQSKLTETTEWLELKNQEIEDLRTIISHSEVEKIELENRMSDIEQYRQEVAKEANQHMEETGEKIRELKIQFENKQEEVNQLSIEKSELESNQKQHIEEIETLNTKNNLLTENSSNTGIITERDNLKDKNEKLTNMCKKYLAKLKQQDKNTKKKEGNVENDQEEEFNRRINELEEARNAAKSANLILVEEMTSKYQIIEELQNQVELKEEIISTLQNNDSEKENKLIEKDDLIRDLKQKLEEAPEDILVPVSVPVNVAEATLAHEKTKTELLNLKEKCKKLIVKVKQQDALLKRKARESTSSEASNINPGDHEELDNLRKALSDQSTIAGENEKKLGDVNIDMKNEIEELKSNLKEVNTRLDQDQQQNADHIESLKKERESLYEEQIALKESVKKLKITNSKLTSKIEETNEELKKVHESNIVNQMQSSSMLEKSNVGAFEDGDDGWGSPEPDIKEVEIKAEPTSKLGENEGWGAWEDTADDLSDTTKLDQKKVKDSEESWGGWDDELPSATPPPVESLAFATGPRKESVDHPTSEREADIEDGWGDDSWSGFGTGEAQGNPTLSENLRREISGSVQDDDGLPSGRNNMSESQPLAAANSQEENLRSVASQLKDRVAEKISVIVSMEIELKNSKHKCVELQDQLTKATKQKENAEKELGDGDGIREQIQLENMELKNLLSDISTSNQSSDKLMSEVEELKEVKVDLENKLADMSLYKDDLLKNFTKSRESLESLENEFEQVKSNFSVKEHENKILLEEKITNIEVLKVDSKSLTEQLENKEDCLSDLQEVVKHMTERRNSLDTMVTELESNLFTKQEEINKLKIKFNDFREQVDQTEKLDNLSLELGEMKEKLKRKDEEIEQLNMMRENIFSESYALKEQVQQLTEENQQLTAGLSQTEIKLSALESELQTASLVSGECAATNQTFRQEIESLQSMVTDVTTENESLQTDLRAVQDQLLIEQSRVSQLLEQLQAVGDGRPQQLAPPDITNNSGGQPDVAQAGRQGVNPDIMLGNVQPPDIMGGQQPLDLVQQQPGGWEWGEENNAGNNWFDDFEPQQPGQYQIPNVEQVHQGLQQQGQIHSREVEIQQLQTRESELVSRLKQLEQQQNHFYQAEQNLAVKEEEIKLMVLREEDQQKNIEHLQILIEQGINREEEVKIILDNLKGKEKDLEALILTHESTIDQQVSMIQNPHDITQDIDITLQQLSIEKQNLSTKLEEITEQLHNCRTGLQGKTIECQALGQQLSTAQAQILDASKAYTEQLNKLQQLELENNELKYSTENKIQEEMKTQVDSQTHSSSELNLDSLSEPVKEQSASMFFEPQGVEASASTYFNSASSFFEECIPQTQSIIQPVPFKDHPSVIQEPLNALPSPNSPHSESTHELKRLQDELRMKVVLSEQLSNEMMDLKDELTTKQDEITLLHKNSGQMEFEKEQLKVHQQEQLNLQSCLQDENLNLKSQIDSLTKSVQLSQHNNEQMQQQVNVGTVLEINSPEVQTGKIDFKSETNDGQDELIKQLSENLAIREQEVSDLMGVEARYTQSLREIEILEESKTQSETYAESMETQLRENISALELRIEEFEKIGAIDNASSTSKQLSNKEVASTTRLFNNEGVASTAQLFSNEEVATTAQLFSNEEVTSTAQLFSNEGAKPSSELFGQQPAANNTASLFEPEQTSQDIKVSSQESGSSRDQPSVGTTGEDENYLAWYQQELAQYQQACQDWQVWGEQKSSEIQELSSSLELQTTNLSSQKLENEAMSLKLEEKEELASKNEIQNIEWQKWGDQKTLEIQELIATSQTQAEVLDSKKSETERLLGELKEKELLLTKSDSQNQLKVKELEVTDLKETIERLESEKDELSEEINEMRSKVDELQNIDETANTIENESVMVELEEAKYNAEENENERLRLKIDLDEARAAMLSLKSSNESVVQGMQALNEQKLVEIESLNVKMAETNTQISDLQSSLEEEKKVQEEVGEEFEAMQLQVIESSSRINELLKQTSDLKEELEKFSNHQEIVKELEESKLKISELTDENVTLKSGYKAKKVESEEDSEENEVTLRPETDISEIDQYKQAVADWAVWADTKNTEYATLLEAYNQYVEAYNNIQSEFNSVLEQHAEESSENTNVEENVLSEEVKRLKNEIEEKTNDINKIQTELDSNEKETAFALVEKETQQNQAIADKDELINQLMERVANKEEEVKDLMGVEERYTLSLKDIEILEESKIQSEMNAESTESQLNENISSLKLRVEELEKELEMHNLQQETEKNIDPSGTNELIKQLYEKLANKEQEVTDLLEVEERYTQSLRDIENLEERKIQNEMNSETSEAQLKEEISKLKLCIEELGTALKLVNQTSVEESSPNTDHSTEELSTQLMTASVELEQYKQTVGEWSVWAESKNTEWASLLDGKDKEILDLKNSLDGKEKELTDKVATIAKISIQSALALKLPSLPASTQEITVQSSFSGDDGLKTLDEGELAWEEDEGWAVGPETSITLPSTSDILILETEISELRKKIIAIEAEKVKALEDVNSSKLKNGKLLVKVKSLTKEMEKLKKNSNGSSGFDDLDKALEDEMKRQLEKCQNELKESRKELENLRLEKDNFSRKIDTLESANERLIEMKEKQDNEVEFINHKNKELTNHIEGLNWNISELEERRETEVAELTSKLAVFTNQEQTSDEADSTQLRLEIASLKKQLAEAQQESQSLRSDLAQISQAHNNALGETALVKSQTIDLQDSIDRLSNENEELKQENKSLKEVSGGESFEEIQKLNETLNSEITSLKYYLEAQNQVGQVGHYSSGQESRQSPGDSGEIERLRGQLVREQQLVLQLEHDLQSKESSLALLESELMSVREQKATEEIEFRTKIEARGRSESMDREIISAFTDNDIQEENFKLKADLDNSLREKRQLAGRIHSWESELGKEVVLDDEGLRGELRRALETLQIKDHKFEELTGENLRLLEERDTLMLKLSTVMRQLEGSRATSAMSSMAGSRTTTPQPAAGGGHFPNMQPVHHFNPHAEIRELHTKLEELRRLNYSLDVELQREKGQRVEMDERVIAPRTRRASQMLAETSPEKVQHI